MGDRLAPEPIEEISDSSLAGSIHLATLAHAVHGIRPAPLLPVNAKSDDPFVIALRRIEFESGRLLQAQILFLKSPDLSPVRGAVGRALEKRHAGIRRLLRETLQSVGITATNDVER
jgi:hypothetical protein